MPALRAKGSLEVQDDQAPAQDTQTPLHMQESGLVTARENVAWPCVYKSQVN